MEAIRYRKEEEMKDSGIEWLGKIPKDWDYKSLKYIFRYTKGKKPSNIISYKEGTLPYITTDFLRTETTDKYVSSGKGLVKVNENDLLLLWDGANAGEFFIGKNGVLGSTFAKFDINTSDNYDYLKYYAKSYEKYLRGMTIGMGIPHVNSDILKNINFVKPINKEEQQKISNFLDITTSQFNLIISKKEKLIEKLEEAKKSLVSEVVTGKVKIVDGEMVERKPEEMKDSGVEWLGKIPKDWEVTKIKNLLKVYSGKEISQGKSQEEDIIDVYGSGGVFKKTNKFLYKGEAILFGRKGTIGKPIYVNKKFWTVDTMYYAITKDNAFTKFIYYQLIIYNWGLITTSTALPSIVGSDLENEYTVVPSLKEQNNIIKSLSINLLNINHIINKTKTQIQKLKEAKQSLISEAVTGKIDLRDWEIREEDVV